MAYEKIVVQGKIFTELQLKEVTIAGQARKVLNFTVSVSNGKNADGTWKDSSFWDCSLWDARAETFIKWMKKGRAVLIDGKPRQRKYEYEKDGQTLRGLALEIEVDGWNFVDSDTEAGQTEAAAPDTSYATPALSAAPTRKPF